MRRPSFAWKLFIGNILSLAAAFGVAAWTVYSAGHEAWAAWGNWRTAGALTVGGSGLAVVSSRLLWRRLRRILAAARSVVESEPGAVRKPFNETDPVHAAERLDGVRDRMAARIADLDRQSQSLQSMIEHLGEGLVAIDGAGRILMMNGAAGELLGIREPDATGRLLSEVVKDPEVMDAYADCVNLSQDIDIQLHWGPDDQKRLTDLRVLRVVKPAPQGVAHVLILHDLSEMADTVRIKAEFVANASHELRTPLATIRAAVDTLAEQPNLDPTSAKCIEILNDHVARLEATATDLLNLSEVEQSDRALHEDHIGIGQLCRQLQKAFEAAAEFKQVALEFRRCGEAMLHIDQKLIRLVLHNLVDNAIKFTPSGGQVTVRIEATADRVVFEIRDTGCGIDVHDQKRIFERFYQADASRSGAVVRRGTGLGLAIVKHAVERLGGVISVDSAPGRGAAFTVDLPRTAARPTKTPLAEEPRKPPPLASS